MPVYEHECRSCEQSWLEDYDLAKCEWLMEHKVNLPCVHCESNDTYRCVTDSGAVHFKGAGWSPDGYSKDQAYEQLKKEGKDVTIYERKEDLERVMKGEKAVATKARLKREDELAKKYLGADAALTQDKADKRIKDAVDKVTV